MKQLQLTIGYLYGDLMNIYGDTGNIITLQKRAQWRNINTRVINISTKSTLKPGQADIYFFGGGQDKSQLEVSKDLVIGNKGQVIKQEVERGVPLLSVCGGYQLLGEYYQPHGGSKLEGVGLFQAYTVAGDKRMIGNIVIDSEFGKLVGFENHSGQTFLKSGANPLGKVISGFGNNEEGKTEGCIYKNAIGCYMHGSLLPKNPHLVDWLLQKALEVKYQQTIELKKLEDDLELKAHQSAIQKFS